ncbi:MAG TPA: biotin--[acetyl-CoA-carboxylase] ligase [Solirubrobacteraceae bacterium]|jgi:BirA family biotin operon repressor/biotin-[acetyl-CoA-carboxylase] ligase|nr:biotin--[acetyl-CoA-carboxylase] ligase [Solirubrobacteraceae bacterium]
MATRAGGEDGPDGQAPGVGHPRLHLRQTGSTNARARALAIAGAPHGTLVSAAEQTAGRGRQGRAWLAPPGSALLCSLVLRNPPLLLPLLAGVAVCDVVGKHLLTGARGASPPPRAAGDRRALVKWPNDVVFADAVPTAGKAPALAKVAGILVEGRPQDNWAVVGIGVNVAVSIEDLPAEVSAGAASLERPASAIEPLLADLLAAFARRLAEPADALLDAWRTRDALRGRLVTWTGGHGRAEGVDHEGRLLVRREDGTRTALSAGEVHFESVG